MNPLDNVIRELARSRADRVRQRLIDKGMSYRQLRNFEAGLNESLGPILNRWQPAMRRGGRGMKDIVMTGTFKNQFETGTSSGAYDPATRAAFSRAYFGMPRGKNANVSREKYGYLKRPAKYGYDDVGEYGHYEIGFKPHVRRSMTVTNGDSLDGFDTWPVISSTPIVVDDPETYINWYMEPDIDYEFKGNERARDMLENLRRNPGPDTDGADYIEAQYHGPLTLDDIRYVKYDPTEVDSDLMEMLESASRKHGFKLKNYNFSDEEVW